MTKINWEVRIRNPLFWLMIFFAIASPIGTYFGLNGKDITSWAILFDVIGNALSNPYLLFTIGIAVFNAIVDPTSKGLRDSGLAMTYSKPNNDGND